MCCTDLQWDRSGYKSLQCNLLINYAYQVVLVFLQSNFLNDTTTYLDTIIQVPWLVLEWRKVSAVSFEWAFSRGRQFHLFVSQEIYYHDHLQRLQLYCHDQSVSVSFWKASHLSF